MGKTDAWYVVQSARFKEKYVQIQLETVGVEAYLPIAKLPRRQVRQGQAQFEPMFPGYVFARLDLSVHMLPLRRLQAVQSLLSFDGRPAVVPGAVIDELRRRERGRGYINIHAPSVSLVGNQPVQVIEGPFQGQVGIFVRYVDSANRVRILLRALQTEVPLELPFASVAPASRVASASAAVL